METSPLREITIKGLARRKGYIACRPAGMAPEAAERVTAYRLKVLLGEVGETGGAVALQGE